MIHGEYSANSAWSIVSAVSVSEHQPGSCQHHSHSNTLVLVQQHLILVVLGILVLVRLLLVLAPFLVLFVVLWALVLVVAKPTKKLKSSTNRALLVCPYY